MPNETPRHISIDVAEDGGDQLKIKWRQDFPWGKAYSVPRGMLEEYSKAARTRLEALVEEAMKGNVKQTGAILKELAQAGNRLYRALFYDPDGGGRATTMRDRLKNLSGDSQVFVSMGVPVHIPWGLVYDGDPEQLSGDPEDTSFNHYRDFWCIKYHVASVYHTVDPEGADQPLPIGALRVHSVVNKSVLDRTAPFLRECGEPLWESVVNRFGPLMHSQRDWLARWKAEYDKVGVLYFYSHADGGNIGLGQDAISANDLAQDLAAQAIGQTLSCLVFLNGCSTAVGAPTGGFLEATAGRRFCGFIGAEASVPEVYALRFGAAFLYEFLRGQSTVLDIMDVFRETHWPLSLLYNVYCVPNLRIEHQPIADPPLDVTNFCDFSLGTRGI